MNNEEEGEVDKLIIIFHKLFHEYDKNRIKNEEGKSDFNLDSVDGLVGDFFSKLALKIRKIIQGENEKNKGIKFLKIINNFFHSIFGNAKKN